MLEYTLDMEDNMNLIWQEESISCSRHDIEGVQRWRRLRMVTDS